MVQLWLSSDTGGTLFYLFQLMQRKAEVLDIMGDWNQAESIHRRGLELAEVHTDERLRADARALLAFSKARDHYRRAIDLCRKLKLRPELAENLNQAAELFLSQGNADRARQLNTEALAAAAEIGRQDVVFSSRLMEARIAARNDRDAAAGMMRALADDRLNDSQRAEVCCHLFKLTGDHDCKRKAREAYQSVYNAAPDLAVKLRLEELAETA
ncbi:MAG: hypothetical protein QME74_12110 [Candidatus Edwardsbacteria bacterium]|nr:hypothetical protein [Candidatus Edwardsbacteria bacterium]